MVGIASRDCFTTKTSCKYSCLFREILLYFNQIQGIMQAKKTLRRTQCRQPTQYLGQYTRTLSGRYTIQSGRICTLSEGIGTLSGHSCT